MLTNLPRVRHPALALLLAVPLLALAACDRGGGPSSAQPSIAGEYAGSVATAAGTRSYRLEIPSVTSGTFPVTGTVSDESGTYPVTGTGRYAHPSVTFELVRVRDGAEDVFGVSGQVSDARDRITLSPGRMPVALRRE